MKNYKTEILNLCEDGVLDWETIAREALAEMSSDDAEDMYNLLGLGIDDDEWE